MRNLTHVMGRVFNTPLAIARGPLDAMVPGLTAALANRGAWERPEKESHREWGVTCDVGPDGIATIYVEGVLVHKKGQMDPDCSAMASYESIGAHIDNCMKDDRVKAVLMEIDSPGGEVAGMFDLAEKVAAAEKPVWAVANEGAYSAAYFLASAAKQIWVPQAGSVGSIGVVAMHRDQSEFDAAVGLKYTYLFAGEKKVDGNPHQPLSKRARSDIQGEVDRLYDMFAGAVSRYRRMDAADVRATEAGIFPAAEAVRMGLADKVGTAEEAQAALAAAIAPKGQSFTNFQSTTERPRGASAQPQENGSMTSPNSTEPAGAALKPAPAEATAPVVDLNAARQEGEANYAAYVSEVMDLCAISGTPEQARAFIDKKTPVASIRKELINARAANDQSLGAIATEMQGLSVDASWDKSVDRVHGKVAQSFGTRRSF